MALKESEAIVLRTYPLRESDLLVTLFTRMEGKVKGVARAAISSNASTTSTAACQSTREPIFATGSTSHLPVAARAAAIAMRRLTKPPARNSDSWLNITAIDARNPWLRRYRRKSSVAHAFV